MAGEVVKIEPARQAHMLPQNFDEATRMASAIAQSGLFGCKTTAEAFSLMLLADAEGLHPAAAARDYHIIEGRPSLKADAMLARYMAAGGKVEWLERSDTRVAANFTHPASGTVMIEWTIERARSIKRKGKSLTDGDNWRNYARQMLAARTISEGVRASFPGVVSGVYTPEEVQDFEPAAPPSRAAIVQDAVSRETPALTEAGADDLSPPAPASSSQVQTMSKSDARADYAELQEGIRTCNSVDELKAWGKLNAKRVELLPADWKTDLRKRYKEMLEGLQYMEQQTELANQERDE